MRVANTLWLYVVWCDRLRVLINFWMICFASDLDLAFRTLLLGIVCWFSFAMRLWSIIIEEAMKSLGEVCGFKVSSVMLEYEIIIFSCNWWLVDDYWGIWLLLSRLFCGLGRLTEIRLVLLCTRCYDIWWSPSLKSIWESLLFQMLNCLIIRWTWVIFLPK